MNVKKLIVPTLTLAGIAALVMIPEVALATYDPSAVAAQSGEGLGKTVTKVTGQLANVRQLIIYVAYVAALGFVFAGVVKFKAHRDNPTQVPLSAPIVLLVVGILLGSIPQVLDIGSESVFEEG